MKVCLGLDVGTKTIGVARGTHDTELVQPLITILRQSVKKDSAKINDICVAQKVGLVVVGLPLHLDGTEGRAVRLARQIGEALRAYEQYEVVYQDERFSTIEAQERLRARGESAKKRKELIDQAAAAVILESWFLENPFTT